jgi:hypothetical protein
MAAMLYPAPENRHPICPSQGEAADNRREWETRFYNFAAEAAASLLISFRTQNRNVRSVTISGVPPAVLVIVCHALLGERLHLLERA